MTHRPLNELMRGVTYVLIKEFMIVEFKIICIKSEAYAIERRLPHAGVTLNGQERAIVSPSTPLDCATIAGK